MNIPFNDFNCLIELNITSKFESILLIYEEYFSLLFNTVSILSIFGVLMIVCILTAIPMSRLFGIVGDVIWLLVFGVTMYFAIRIEKTKKKYDIYTYREIVAFTKGEKLDTIEKAREEGKRRYQVIILLLGSGLIGIVIAHIIYTILEKLSLI